MSYKDKILILFFFFCVPKKVLYLLYHVDAYDGASPSSPTILS